MQSPEKMENFKLYQMHLQGKDTDCTFEFKNETVELVHAHKTILSVASDVFATNFKSEWKGDLPITVNSMDCALFKRLLRAIYISDLSFESLNEAFELYEAAHFYQVEGVLDLLRVEVQKFCVNKQVKQISRLVNTAWKYHDIKLIGFSGNFFIRNPKMILLDPDFLNCTPDSVNFLYQFNDFPYLPHNMWETDFLDTLEKYLDANQSVSLQMLKPAIGSIRFLAIKDRQRIEKTSLLIDVEKDSLLGKNSLNFSYLSKRIEERRFNITNLGSLL